MKKSKNKNQNLKKAFFWFLTRNKSLFWFLFWFLSQKKRLWFLNFAGSYKKMGVTALGRYRGVRDYPPVRITRPSPINELVKFVSTAGFEPQTTCLQNKSATHYAKAHLPCTHKLAHQILLITTFQWWLCPFNKLTFILSGHYQVKYHINQYFYNLKLTYKDITNFI